MSELADALVCSLVRMLMVLAVLALSCLPYVVSEPIRVCERTSNGTVRLTSPDDFTDSFICEEHEPTTNREED